MDWASPVLPVATGNRGKFTIYAELTKIVDNQGELVFTSKENARSPRWNSPTLSYHFTITKETYLSDRPIKRRLTIDTVRIP